MCVHVLSMSCVQNKSYAVELLSIFVSADDQCKAVVASLNGVYNILKALSVGHWRCLLNLDIQED